MCEKDPATCARFGALDFRKYGSSLKMGFLKTFTARCQKYYITNAPTGYGGVQIILRLEFYSITCQEATVLGVFKENVLVVQLSMQRKWSV